MCVLDVPVLDVPVPALPVRAMVLRSELVPPTGVARISAARSNDRQANQADMRLNYGRRQLAPCLAPSALLIRPARGSPGPGPTYPREYLPILRRSGAYRTQAVKYRC